MKKSNDWIILLTIMVTLVVTIIFVNVSLVSVFKYHIRSGTDLTPYVVDANVTRKEIQAKRGMIFDSKGSIIAQDVRTYDIVCILDKNRPSMDGVISYVDDPAETAYVLSGILGMDEVEVYRYLTKDVYQTELGVKGRNLSKETKEKIESYNLNGIEFKESIKRLYPLNSFASHLIGYAQSDENGIPVGKMGLELFLNDDLTGTNGYIEYQTNKDGYILPGMKEEITPAIDGHNVQVTLIRDLQEALETSFQQSIKEHNATKLWGGVMEVSTGKLLAYGQYPTFDPNKLDIKDYNNYGSQYTYEPGSTMKVFPYSAAINEGLYDGHALVNSDPFCYTSDGSNPVRTYGNNAYGCIYNARKKKWGYVEYDYGLIYSANTVTSSLVTEVITPEIYSEYLDRFGFFKPVDVYGIPETNGVKNYTWPSDKLALSFGQGSTVNMLQLFQAYSAIFNDGEMVKPYYIERVFDAYDPNITYYQAETTSMGQVITEESAKQVQNIMRRVVSDEQGTARFYAIDDVDIIAKTGTSEIADPNGGYKDNEYITSIMIGLPADDPQYLFYYAYESEYDRNTHFEVDAVKSMIRKIAMECGLIDEEVNKDYVKITKKIMPNLVNHTVEFANNKLEDTSNVIILGDGKTVINQYPKPDYTYLSNQKVYLLTDYDSITMPNMIGWTRKDITDFWNVTGIPIKMDGYGSVKSQSIEEGTILKKDYLIEVCLE